LEQKDHPDRLSKINQKWGGPSECIASKSAEKWSIGGGGSQHRKFVLKGGTGLREKISQKTREEGANHLRIISSEGVTIKRGTNIIPILREILGGRRSIERCPVKRNGRSRHHLTQYGGFSVKKEKIPWMSKEHMSE